MTSNAERFAALVAHPYGLAAVEMSLLSARSRFMAFVASGYETVTAAVLRKKYEDAVALRDEIAGARARARGMGDG